MSVALRGVLLVLLALCGACAAPAPRGAIGGAARAPALGDGGEVIGIDGALLDVEFSGQPKLQITVTAVDADTAHIDFETGEFQVNVGDEAFTANRRVFAELDRNETLRLTVTGLASDEAEVRGGGGTHRLAVQRVSLGGASLPYGFHVRPGGLVSGRHMQIVTLVFGDRAIELSVRAR